MLQMELLFPAPLHPRLGTPPPITTISASSQGCRRDGDLDLESSQGLSFSHVRSIPQSRITFQTRLLYTLLPSSLASTRSQPNHKTASLASSLGLALPTHSTPTRCQQFSKKTGLLSAGNSSLTPSSKEPDLRVACPCLGSGSPHSTLISSLELLTFKL